MSTHPRVAVALVGLSFLLPIEAEAQFEFLDVQVYGAHATETFDGSRGLGAGLSWDLPGLPVSVRATAERYFPSCGPSAGNCSTWGYGGDVLVYLPMTVVRPYGVAGLTHRRADLGDDLEDEDEDGVGVGAGIDVSLAGLRLFGEARREFLHLPGDQWVLRVGLIL